MITRAAKKQLHLKTNSKGSGSVFEEVLKYFRHFFSNARFSASSEPHSNFSIRFTDSFDLGSIPVGLIIPGLVVVVVVVVMGRKGRALTLWCTRSDFAHWG